MAWNGTIMTKPIGIGDISRAVGNSSLDVATLIAKGSIKKWALHKPVMLITGYDTPKDISSDSTWETYMKNYVRSVSDNSVLAPYGLLVGTSTNIYEISGETPNAAVDWVYQQPPETGSFHRRMLDFNGYTNTPNTPMDGPDDFTYYRNTDSSNTFRIVVYDGEAGSTSIPISELFDTTTLGDYNLMVTFKAGNLWYYTIMDDSLADAVSPGGGEIYYTLPTNFPSNSSVSNGTYQGYVCGIKVTDSQGGRLYTDTWNTFTDATMQNSYLKIPLPFANKHDCKFNFTVAQSSPTNIVNITYTFYLSSSYKIKRIRFEASKQGSVVNNYSISLSNLIIRNDNDIEIGRITNDSFVLNNWTTSNGVSTAYAEKNVESYNINTGGDDYPNINESLLNITQSGSYDINVSVSGNAIIE